ncbi:MAG: hypothetical protein FWE88_06730 [Phycisphaerae bacterium]|nr:hypothetical protein [Phycisphaerae bacterium]
MDIVNAIAKARFNSARAQRVPLHKTSAMHADLLCLEAGQSLDVPDGGAWTYYVIAGTVAVSQQQAVSLPQGHSVGVEGPHTLRNVDQRRLILLAVGT